MLRAFMIVLVGGVLIAAARADVRPHAGMLRYPDVSATHIVFVYANDLWIVPREGGVALPLASPPGPETFPRFSPDGAQIAFVGNYDGNRDLYVIPRDGGTPTRVTYHPAAETLNDVAPDGDLIFSTNGLAGLPRQQQLFRVSPAGGLPSQLPVPYGANGAISPDGQWLAYTPHSTDQRTWKRYRGGMATDIWLFHLTRHESVQMTVWEGTDSIPMWHAQTVYYLSDAGANHRLNIWAYDTAARTHRQVTDFADYDVKFPAIGPGPAGGGEIVFQLGPELMLLDLASGKSAAVKILIPGDRPTIRPRAADVSQTLGSFDVSPGAKRVAIEARGDLWTAPAEKGSPRNLTRSSGVAERMPSWSPDGRWIAYFSDESGEYELYVMQCDGKSPPRRLTTSDAATLPAAFRYNATWSPDSKHIVFTDKAGNIFLHALESDRTRRIDVDPWAQQPRVSWSHDSNWLTYAKGGRNQRQSVWLYDIEAGQAHAVTAGMFSDSWPVFDREGKYLFFASGREITAPIYDHTGETFVYVDPDVLMVVPLRKDIPSPFAPKSDEQTWTEAPASQPAAASASAPATTTATTPADPAAEAGQAKKPEKLKIDIEGFESRAVRVPVDRGSFYRLQVSDKGHLLYVRGPRPGSGGEPSLQVIDLAAEKREEKTVIAGVGSYAITADGKKLAVAKGGSIAIIDAAPDQKMDKTVSRDGMTVQVEPREEWRQIFTEAWRIQRDYFYDPNMHGVDWAAVRRQYEPMLADCTSREDVSYVIGEMIAELNVGHAYVWGSGAVDPQPEVSVGLLGCDFALESGGYRISRVYSGAAWDIDARGPLSQPGVDVKVGDYLLAVNGVPVDATRSPWAALQGMAGRTVTLTVGAAPPQVGAASQPGSRDVVIELLASEVNLRYRDWIERKRAYVAEKTGGRVGYVYVPNTGVDGQTDLFRQVHGQLDKDALIIDERWNGGGQIPVRFIELLNRPIYNYWAKRDGYDWYSPSETIPGPKCMLINGLAGSGGDAFPHYFRKAGLGKLIGTRTWGGLVGISGNPGFVDGGSTTAPTFAFYDPDGTWGIEGHGVDPDMVVIDDPAKMVDGGDPQLDAAIAHMLEELKLRPYVTPKRPAYPDRKGMGIAEEDK